MNPPFWQMLTEAFGTGGEFILEIEVDGEGTSFFRGRTVFP